MFLLHVQESKDNDSIAFDSVKDFVRKTPGDEAAKIPIVNRPPFRMLLKIVDRFLDGGQEFIAQSRSLQVIVMLRGTAKQ